MKDERFDRDDSDADLRALQTAMAEFVSQSDISAPRPDEPPPRAPVDTARRSSRTAGTHQARYSRNSKRDAGDTCGAGSGPQQSGDADSNRRDSGGAGSYRCRHGVFEHPCWRAYSRSRSQASVAAAISWWPAVGRRAQVAPARGPVVQAQSPTPPGQTPQHTPRSPVREAQPAGRVARPPVRETQHPRTVARPPARAPNNVALPVRRAAAARPPLPAPVVDPPVPAVSWATLSPPVVPSISERVAPLPEPGAVNPPGTVYQELPRPLVIVDRAVSVLLVLIINEHGRVDRAFIGSMPVLPRYRTATTRGGQDMALHAGIPKWPRDPISQNVTRDSAGVERSSVIGG